MENHVIAIVGQSGSWKSTVGRILSDNLQFQGIDVGKLWRAIGVTLLASDLDPSDPQACMGPATMLLNAAAMMRPTNNRVTLLAERIVDRMGVVPGQLKEYGVGDATAKSTAHPAVRAIVAEAVRNLYWPGGTVVIGRPFVYKEVFPDCFLKVLLHGDLDLRAGNNRSRETRDEIQARDRIDGVDTITHQTLSEVSWTYNLNDGSCPEDVATAIWLLAWQRSPIRIPNPLAL